MHRHYTDPRYLTFFVHNIPMNLIKFSYITIIFNNVHTIYSSWTDWDYKLNDYSSSIIDEQYIEGLLSEIDKINQNKQTKLHTIYIRTAHKDISKKSLSVLKTKSKWNIKKMNNKKIRIQQNIMPNI